MKTHNGFVTGRIKSLKYTLRGAFLLLKTEHSIITQLLFGFGFVILGFYFNITKTEWMFQAVGIGVMLAAESLNTAIEKLCDFVHPDYHRQIGLVKDIAAGAITFVFVSDFILALIIYSPYLYEKFI